MFSYDFFIFLSIDSNDFFIFLYTVIFYYPLKKWGGHGPHLPLSQFPQLGGPGMLELWNLLNIKEYSETLRSKKV
jgi:hypothetical protein